MLYTAVLEICDSLYISCRRKGRGFVFGGEEAGLVYKLCQNELLEYA